MNIWLIIGVVWALGMVFAWAFVHGAAKLRAEEDVAMAGAPASVEEAPLSVVYDTSA